MMTSGKVSRVLFLLLSLHTLTLNSHHSIDANALYDKAAELAPKVNDNTKDSTSNFNEAETLRDITIPPIATKADQLKKDFVKNDGALTSGEATLTTVTADVATNTADIKTNDDKLTAIGTQHTQNSAKITAQKTAAVDTNGILAGKLILLGSKQKQEPLLFSIMTPYFL